MTTTWHYTRTGQTVESNGQHNTYYAWSILGELGAMDILKIGVRAIRHTFGLNHPNGSSPRTRCLSMYAYDDLGETQTRTLGDGGILGIQAVYGR